MFLRQVSHYLSLVGLKLNCLCPFPGVLRLEVWATKPRKEKKKKCVLKLEGNGKVKTEKFNIKKVILGQAR